MNEFLTKAMGLDEGSYWWCFNCLAEKSPHQVTYEENCTLCGKPVEWIAAHIFTEPPDFVALLLWSQDDARTYVPQGGPEKWTWEEFWWWAWDRLFDEMDTLILDYPTFSRWLFNPERFAPLLAEFLGWREGK